jgi:hypothetical protein
MPFSRNRDSGKCRNRQFASTHAAGGLCRLALKHRLNTNLVLTQRRKFVRTPTPSRMERIELLPSNAAVVRGAQLVLFKTNI